MKQTIKIPFHAKLAVLIGIKSLSTFSKTQEKKLAINKGKETANILMSNDRIDRTLAKAIARYWIKFRKNESEEATHAIDLWGGERFGKELAQRYYHFT